MTDLEFILMGACATLIASLALVERFSYRAGVRDGAYNQHLPDVQATVRSDPRYPPPCHIRCIRERLDAARKLHQEVKTDALFT